MLCFEVDVGLQKWWGWCGTGVHDVGLCTLWESLLMQGRARRGKCARFPWQRLSRLLAREDRCEATTKDTRIYAFSLDRY
jgi:hypothetical protein